MRKWIKRSHLLCLYFFCLQQGIMQAQKGSRVGMNTVDPKATLDVQGEIIKIKNPNTGKDEVLHNDGEKILRLYDSSNLRNEYLEKYINYDKLGRLIVSKEGDLYRAFSPADFSKDSQANEAIDIKINLDEDVNNEGNKSYHYDLSFDVSKGIVLFNFVSRFYLLDSDNNPKYVLLFGNVAIGVDSRGIGTGIDLTSCSLSGLGDSKIEIKDNRSNKVSIKINGREEEVVFSLENLKFKATFNNAASKISTKKLEGVYTTISQLHLIRNLKLTHSP